MSGSFKIKVRHESVYLSAVFRFGSGRMCWTKACAIFLVCAATAIDLPAQTFTTLFSFDNTNGANPEAGLVQATDGNFYGTTVFDGAYNGGTVFRVTPSGTLTTLYSFCAQTNCTDGANPEPGLVQASNGDFYGTTYDGGAQGDGTVFRISPSGALTTIYSFCAQMNCTDGVNPVAGLSQTKGDFYGTTEYGGAYNAGTVFQITPSGKLTTLYSFCAQKNCPDGQYPASGLLQGSNGNFYGTTKRGGAHHSGGTIFEITQRGTLTTLYSFCAQTGCMDGEVPYGGLVEDSNGDLYGTTISGGAQFGNPEGTVFRITPSGTLTTLHRFCSQSLCADGEVPYAGLVQATDGNFYGTTVFGGAHAGGEVFEITPGGTLTTLYSFCAQTNCTDGEAPYAGLVQATSGDFYGTTEYGGAGNAGVVFSLSIGLGPFVKTKPTAGEAGAAVEILGTNLSGATSVTFNGITAVFKVASGSSITATVPAAAASGTVQVVTPGGTLSSNEPFRVLP
jgi:uncharacterized repeat protein (TIGR03803 family)